MKEFNYIVFDCSKEVETGKRLVAGFVDACDATDFCEYAQDFMEIEPVVFYLEGWKEGEEDVWGWPNQQIDFEYTWHDIPPLDSIGREAGWAKPNGETYEEYKKERREELV